MYYSFAQEFVKGILQVIWGKNVICSPNGFSL